MGERIGFVLYQSCGACVCVLITVVSGGVLGSGRVCRCYVCMCGESGLCV